MPPHLETVLNNAKRAARLVYASHPDSIHLARQNVSCILDHLPMPFPERTRLIAIVRYVPTGLGRLPVCKPTGLLALFFPQTKLFEKLPAARLPVEQLKPDLLAEAAPHWKAIGTDGRKCGLVNVFCLGIRHVRFARAQRSCISQARNVETYSRRFAQEVPRLQDLVERVSARMADNVTADTNGCTNGLLVSAAVQR